MTDPADSLHLDVVTDLVGALAYGELTAFTRLASDARLAPTLADEIAMAGYAARRFSDFRRLTDHLRSLGVDADAAMAPFVAPLDAFHDQTEPSSWLEGLVKVFVGDGIARDFYREMAGLLDIPATATGAGDAASDQSGDATTGAVLERVLATEDQAEVEGYVVARVRGAIADDPSTAGRLALWARRLVGEALSQTQRVAAERDALLLLVGARSDLGEMMRLLTRVTDAHTRRMERLGLSG